jgi:hypothetical protein
MGAKTMPNVFYAKAMGYPMAFAILSCRFTTSLCGSHGHVRTGRGRSHHGRNKPCALFRKKDDSVRSRNDPGSDRSRPGSHNKHSRENRFHRWLGLHSIRLRIQERVRHSRRKLPEDEHILLARVSETLRERRHKPGNNLW